MYIITKETYSAGSEGRCMLDYRFKTERQAYRFLRKKHGKLKRFEHKWLNSDGAWVAPIKQGVPKKYYCISKVDKSE